jgi:hypothetical protein
MIPLEVLSMAIQGFIGFLLAYFAYDFLSEFKELRKSVNNLNQSMALVVNRLEDVETDHGRRIQRLEERLP